MSWLELRCCSWMHRESRLKSEEHTSLARRVCSGQQNIAQDFAMSDFSLTLVLHFKTSKIFNGMAKVQIKSEKITPFGGIFHVREQFSRFVGPVIDKVLGLRCTSYGYQYSEIAGTLASVYFCGDNRRSAGTLKLITIIFAFIEPKSVKTV